MHTLPTPTRCDCGRNSKSLNHEGEVVEAISLKRIRPGYKHEQLGAPKG